eukprot:4569408-Pyramimonas_sp.AAC.1
MNRPLYEPKNDPAPTSCTSQREFSLDGRYDASTAQGNSLTSMACHTPVALLPALAAGIGPRPENIPSCLT